MKEYYLKLAKELTGETNVSSLIQSAKTLELYFSGGFVDFAKKYVSDTSFYREEDNITLVGGRQCGITTFLLLRALYENTNKSVAFLTTSERLVDFVKNKASWYRDNNTIRFGNIIKNTDSLTEDVIIVDNFSYVNSVVMADFIKNNSDKNLIMGTTIENISDLNSVKTNNTTYLVERKII